MALGFLLLDELTSAIPDKMLSNEANFKVLKVSFGDGYEQRAASGINNIGSLFSLSFVKRTADEVQDITDFFDDKEGVSSFDFTYPTATGENTIKVICEKYAVSYITCEYFSCSATFKRVYEA